MSITISASSVNELRQKTGVGLMDCKKALLECNGDIDEASQWLRKKGLAVAAKKSGRITAEGLVGVAIDTSERKGVIIEVNSETDFVAKNEKFQTLCNHLLSDAINYDGDVKYDITQFKSSISNLTGKSISDELAESIVIIGENINLRRMAKINVEHGVVVSYIHNQVSSNLGKIAVLVGFETDIDAVKVRALGKQIAMHIAASKPESLDISDLDENVVNKERNFIIEQASTSGKPTAVIEKMVEGRLSKFYEQVVLLEQTFIIDSQTKISQVLANFAKENNSDIKLKQFIYFVLGEGIEKEKINFAEEIASLNK